jgi:hypothetical protein
VHRRGREAKLGMSARVVVPHFTRMNVFRDITLSRDTRGFGSMHKKCYVNTLKVSRDINVEVYACTFLCVCVCVCLESAPELGLVCSKPCPSTMC